MARGSSKSSKGGKKPFGGFSINFKGANDSLASVFGETPIGPAEMTKKLWAYVKRRKLSGKR
jgi:chromatin remodeling complex protein RSC6